MEAEAVRPIPAAGGYAALLRANRDFRNLWLGQVVSEFGDWFTLVALFNLLLELTGRAQAMSWLMIVMHIPSIVTGPLGGILIDRVDRKRLMIATDVARAILVLGFLAVRSAESIWIVYLVAGLEASLSTIFEPARTAVVPNICARDELVRANAISSVTWSAMVTIGAAIGGIVVAALGREVSFLIDSSSFVVSALLIRRVRVPPRAAAAQPPMSPSSGWRDVAEGFRYVRAHRPVLALLLVKTGLCLGGGFMTLLGIFGQKIFPIFGSPAAGMGALFGVRGIGTAIGPIAARRIAGEGERGMRLAILAGFLIDSAFYLAFARAGSVPVAWLTLLLAHMGGSITWVFSTVLLQIAVPDALRGRVFSLEFALLTLALALSNYLAGYALDVAGLAPRTVAALIGVYFAIPGLAWLAAQRLFRSRALEPH